MRARGARCPAWRVAGALAVWLMAGSVRAVAAQEQAAAEAGEWALSLEDAIAEALEGNASLRMETARREMAEATAAQARSVFWPRLDVESGVTRSTDPVFAFGTRLRQERFTQADFDLDRLNRPEAIDDWSTGARVTWKVFGPTEWAAEVAAAHAASAARWSETRSREAIILETEARYLEAQRAEAHYRASVRAEEAARSARDVFRQRVGRGLLTRADLLQAESDLASALARRIDADRRRVDALRRLVVFLGRPPDRLPVLTDTLELQVPAPAPPESPWQAFDPLRRADLRALLEARAAASAEHKSAMFSYVPEVDAFADYSIHGEDPFARDGDSWTVGVGLRWNLFGGLARRAQVRRAGAARAMAEVRLNDAVRRAQAELAEAKAAVQAAQRAVEASLAAERAAAEGTRLMRRRFEEGLATATEVLAAESRAAATRSRAIDAVASHRLAEARLRFLLVQHSHQD